MDSASHVTHLRHQDRDLYLLGTAHVSHRSVQEVKEAIEEIRPDTVCVELDVARHQALVDDNRWRQLDLFQVIREKRVLYLLANLALSAYQRRIGDRLGIRPGAELLAAVRTAEKIGARVVLADRDLQVTLKRTWASLSWLSKLNLTSALLAAPFVMEELTEERVEAMRDRDTISEMLGELAEAMPGLREPLIDERDRYLVDSVLKAPGSRILAVVGAGHVQGMLANLDTPVDRAAITQLPPPSRLGRILGWGLPLVVLVAFFFGWREHQQESLLEMLKAWIIPTSLGCGVATALALAHPLTILSAILAAPLTTLNPLIGAGMVTALVEAWVRRPTVADCEAIPEAVLSLRGWLHNRATRVLLVFVLSSLGASVGMAVGVAWVLTLLG